MELPLLGGRRYDGAMRALAFAFALIPASVLLAATARAGDPPGTYTVPAVQPAPPPPGQDAAPPPAPPPAASPGPDAVAPKPSPFARETPRDDPTGGAYTTPTLLFIPAGAVPTWNVRVIASLDMQGPAPASRLGVGMSGASTTGNPLSSVGFQPGIGGELGLPFGFTFGAGTDFVGGDQSPANCATFPQKSCPTSAGLSPYFQLRYHIVGDKSGQGFQLGASATYKFVGFQGDPGEIEIAVSGQYRSRWVELGLQAVIGKDFATTDSDGEVHTYVVVRPIAELALGVAGQFRYGLVAQPGETREDAVSGLIASVTLGRWQIGGLGGESSIGLSSTPQIRVGALGEAFATARF
jgi:hypothetical protein